MSLFSNLKEKWNTTRAREKEKMANMTFKQKVSYIFTAWGLEIVVGLVVIIMIGFGIYLIDNATNTHILTVAIVDSELSEEKIDTFAAEFKDYMGNGKRKEVISVEANIPSESGTREVLEDYYLLEMQQFGLTLAASGAMDCYIATESYMEFLKGYEVLVPAKDILGAELAGEYASLTTQDGLGIRLSEGAEDYFCLEDGDYYLVYMLSAHYPEVIRSFTRFVMEK